MPKPLKYLKSAPVEDYYLGSSLISVLVEISKEQDGGYLLTFKRDAKETQGIFLETSESLIDVGETVTSRLINLDCQAHVYGLDSTIKKYNLLGKDEQIFDYLPPEQTTFVLAMDNEVTHYDQVNNVMLLGGIGLFLYFKEGSETYFSIGILDAFLKRL